MKTRIPLKEAPRRQKEPARLGALVLVLILAGWPMAAQPALSAKDRIVVLISLDGFPGWAFEDPRLPVPTLRRLADGGVLARGMQVSNPAVTWPNHTTLVTGVPPARHGVLANGLLVREGPRAPLKIYPWRSKSELVRVPTVYDLANRAGLTAAQVNWVAILNAGTISWEFAERPNPAGAIEREMVAAGVITQSELESFNDSSTSNPAWRDHYWTQAAVHIIKRHRPNLLLFHLLNIDGTHHRYSAKTPAGYTALAYADACVKQVLDALAAAGLSERASLLVVSDHGFKSARRSIRPNAVLREQGLLKAEGQNIECDAYVVPEGGIALLYVTDPQNRARMAPRLKELFGSVEGIERIIEPPEYASLGLPAPSDNDQMSDLVLVAKDGYNFSGTHEGSAVVDVGGGGIYPGHHGALSTDPAMNAMFLASGYGIRSGVRLDVIDNVDVAPTIARLLGLRMEEIVGKELSQILR